MDNRVILCGAEVACKPINPQLRSSSLVPKGFVDVLLDTPSVRRGGRNGDQFVADWDDVEDCEPISDIHIDISKQPRALIFAGEFG